MAISNKQNEKVYSQNTVIIVATVCVLAGFIGGVIVSAVKTTGRMPQPQQSSPPQAMPQQPNIQERAGELDALIKETAQNPQNTKAWADLGNLFVWVAVGATLLFGAIGFIDDYLKVSRRRNLGQRPPAVRLAGVPLRRELQCVRSGRDVDVGAARRRRSGRQ